MSTDYCVRVGIVEQFSNPFLSPSSSSAAEDGGMSYWHTHWSEKCEPVVIGESHFVCAFYVIYRRGNGLFTEFTKILNQSSLFKLTETKLIFWLTFFELLNSEWLTKFLGIWPSGVRDSSET